MNNETTARLHKKIGPNGGYSDLGAIIDTTNMAAGATVYSNWIDGIDWVRNILIMAQSDQQYDLGITRRDSFGVVTSDYVLITNNAANSGSYRPFIANATSLVATSGLTGYSARFFIKNSSASPNTIGKLRVQLMGL